MLVKYWMRKTVITVDVSDSMQEAVRRMKEYFVPLLPVLEAGNLVGIITDRDLKRASASDATSLDVHELAYLISKIKAGDIMSKNPITVPMDYTLEETAELLLRNRISGVPVTDEKGRLAGTISQREIFRALIAMSGLAKRGIHFGFQLEDRPGAIKEVTDLIRQYEGRLVSILSSSERAPGGFRHVYVRAYNIDRTKLPKLTEELREKGSLLYMVDHRDNKRAEFLPSPRVV
jgi:acetoin utilization protein AcuB